MRDSDLLALVAILAPLSIASIGGAASVYAPLQHQTVDVHHWLTGQEFIDLFAIARVTPGPGTMLATLIGWKVAGLPGALVATLALFLPATLVCYAVARVWNRYRGKPWHEAFEQGLAPIGAGLLFAGVLAILRIGAGGPLSWVTAAGVAGLLVWRPKLHPFALLTAGAVLFIALQWVSK
ncbi:MAG: chromate transporter [Rhizobiales bacterium]|nr:chromate transporter [Hyphomicrobiales bacterium]